MNSSEKHGPNKAFGNLGEGYARGYLKRCGYNLVKAPFNCRSGEIDIIAMDGNTLVFIEVKIRRSDQFGSPIEAVTPAKQRKIARVAQVYLAYYNKRNFEYCRFDVLGIKADPATGINEIIHIKDAFRLDR
ncbi:YraN family protein [bacterium]|nr:YraN family protein [bacterium]